MEHMAHVAMNTLIWEAAIMLWIIGLVELGVDKRHDPKDFGWVLLTGGLMETVAMCFLIGAGDMFGATAAAAFILLLWVLGVGLVTGTNRAVQNHAIWFTGFYFLGATIFTASHHLVFLSFMLGILVPLTWLLSLANYTGIHGLAKIGGFLSAVDGILFFIWALSTAIGHHLP